MDFTLDETDEALRDLTARILADQATPDRSKAAEADARAGGPGVDRSLWSALAGAGLLAAFLDPTDPSPPSGDWGRERVGASGNVTGPAGDGSSGDWGRERVDTSGNVTGPAGDGSSGDWGRERVDTSGNVTGPAGDGSPGVVAAALMCREFGTTVAPVPLASTLTALLAARDCPEPAVVAACAAVAAGEGWAAVAAPETGGATPRWRPVRAAAGAAGTTALSGAVGLVADLPGSTFVVVEAIDDDGATGSYWVEMNRLGVTVEPVVTTAGRVAGHLTLVDVPAVPLAGPPARLVLQTLMCATQAGVCGSAVSQAATYLNTRHQFGRPIASFQAPVHRLVDAHIDTDAIWLTTLLAAWRLDQGMDAAAAVDVARWWAADAGNRAVHTVQHLHGGMGADVDYPVHRFFLWAKTLGDSLGGGAAHLAHLGGLIAAGAHL